MALLGIATALVPSIARPPETSLACITPPCVATCWLVSRTESATCLIDPDEEFTVEVLVEITNATFDGVCGGPGPIDLTVEVVQEDDFDDATEISLPIVDSLEASLTDSSLLSVTFPADAEPGRRTFEIAIEAESESGEICTRDLVANLYLVSVVEIVDVSTYSCGIPGDPSLKTFLITNQTDEERTIDYEISSVQTATTSSTGEGDHFPLVFEDEILGHGDPTDPEPPVITGSVFLPAGVGSAVEVSFLTASFPACHGGSQCIYELVGTDMETGAEVGSRTAHTVIENDWEGCEFAECVDDRFCQSPGAAINDLAPLENLLEIPSNILVDDLNVELSLTHPNPGELTIEMESPSGTSITLFETAADLTNLEFDIEFDNEGEEFDAVLIDDDTLVQPAGPGFLTDLTAETALGFWTLRIVDGEVGGDGTLDEWCLSFSCPRQLVDFKRGDVDGSGEVSALLDTLFLFEWLFIAGSEEITCLDAADVDNSGTINILDGLSLLLWAFDGGAPPPFPGPGSTDCGPDADDSDPLDCATPTC